jgi:hypothetical protein
VSDVPPQVRAEIAEVLRWIESHPGGRWEDMGDLYTHYRRWWDIIMREKLLDDTGDMETVPRLSSFGRLFLLSTTPAVGTTAPIVPQGGPTLNLNTLLSAPAHTPSPLSEIYDLVAPQAGGQRRLIERTGDDTRAGEVTPTDLREDLPASGGGTAEERVRHYLDRHTDPQIDEAQQITGLTELRIRRTQAWKDCEEKALDAYLRKQPDAETPDVEREFGFSAAKTVGMNAWKDHRERKNAAKPPRKIKERPLGAAADFRPDEGAADPSKQVDARDQLLHRILQAVDRDTRGQLNRLSVAEQNRLIDHLLAQCPPTEGGDEGSMDRLTIVVEVARSWLEEREQEGRHSGRKSRRS